MPDFIENLKDTLVHGEDNVSVTENGALGYKTTGKNLLDLNFAITSLRNETENGIWDRFLAAYNENPDLALAWLFFARDPRGGTGERRLFRVIFPRFSSRNPSVAVNLLKFIPEYGRWDDLIHVIDKTGSKIVREAALKLLCDQLAKDIADAAEGKPISLAAKWLPSENSSSRDTKRLAKLLRAAFDMTPRKYRRTLSALRRHIDVVERKMSANEWQDINYQGVPSKAMLNYRKAFLNHDEDGFQAYLEAVKSGEAKIHSGTLFPHEIYHAYPKGGLDETLEAQWKALPNTVPPDKGTLVVVDGSGSMTDRVSANATVSCLDVSRSLGIYFAERLTGPYKDHFITFSSHPEMVYLHPNLSLMGKIDIMRQHNDCSNTNIEKVFDLVLKTAVKHRLSQSELPANILVISDMEFDDVANHRWDGTPRVDQTLFNQLADRYEQAGYKLPRLAFWNVCSRTGTIPLIENELGVALVSGFSPSIADMVMSGKLDPWECLVDKLTSERYLPILKEVRSAYGRNE